ncbi:uncharacterized protein LY79DRAFT_548020 [Colletotrichum navitas]|uniref:Uncharacterized protein n=1 Tax=Colletotrichum navitas TaxID=681940 RepID=A0AAD8Q3W4_9PEZI|nr:uncharacterized protein LY79DRAFT_548020 [Colletotrichum navitas]KAK1595074.1 hypothetical protein LY79DRAFT_548020 [Colletotrichum navitas]
MSTASSINRHLSRCLLFPSPWSDMCILCFLPVVASSRLLAYLLASSLASAAGRVPAGIVKRLPCRIALRVAWFASFPSRTMLVFPFTYYAAFRNPLFSGFGLVVQR